MHYVIAFYDLAGQDCLYKEEDMFCSEEAAEKCAKVMFGGAGNLVTLWEGTSDEAQAVVTIVQMA